MSTVTTLMTAAEFCEFVHRPENDGKWFELVRGEVIELPPPQPPHGIVCANIVFLLSAYMRKVRKGHVTSNDEGVIVAQDPDTVRGPDVGYYDDDATAKQPTNGYNEIVPLLAAEVLSTSDLAQDVNQKVVEFLKSGVKLVWVVNPKLRTVTIYRPDNGPTLLTENDEITGEDVLPGFRCKVADFFYKVAK